jgi:hypothetical protein
LTFFEKAEMSFVDEGFEWNIEIDEQIFHPDISSDCKKLEPPSVPQVSAVTTSVLLMGMTPLGLILHKRRKNTRNKVLG